MSELTRLRGEVAHLIEMLRDTRDEFSDHATLVDENQKMAKFIKSQGFWVEDVIFFGGDLDR